MIGEAVKNVPLDFRKKYPSIEWKAIAGTRDIMIHAYFDVDYDAVWDIAKKDLPALKKEVKRILDEKA